MDPKYQDAAKKILALISQDKLSDEEQIGVLAEVLQILGSLYFSKAPDTN